ncbi:hypothetical protein HK096_010203, partial [Nowakowskiella sp. JEL0078]
PALPTVIIENLPKEVIMDDFSEEVVVGDLSNEVVVGDLSEELAMEDLPEEIVLEDLSEKLVEQDATEEQHNCFDLVIRTVSEKLSNTTRNKQTDEQQLQKESSQISQYDLKWL